MDEMQLTLTLSQETVERLRALQTEKGLPAVEDVAREIIEEALWGEREQRWLKALGELRQMVKESGSLEHLGETEEEVVANLRKQREEMEKEPPEKRAQRRAEIMRIKAEVEAEQKTDGR